MRYPLRLLNSISKAIPNTRGEGGQSAIEYSIVAFFAVILLLMGDPSPLARLMQALSQFYQDYAWALSITAIP